MKLPPDTPLAGLSWIPKPRVAPLRRMGLETLNDLVLHFPRRHEDRSRFTPFPDAPDGRPVLVCGVIVKVGYLPFGKWRRGFEAVVEEHPGGPMARQLTLRWFNMPHVAKSVSVGFQIVAYGKPKQRGKRLILDFPEYELIEEPGDESVHVGRIVPVHPAADGISAKKLRELIFEAIRVTDLDAIASLIPGADAPHGEAISHIHFPPDAAALESAREQLVLDEFFSIQALLASRRSTIINSASSAKTISGALWNQLRRNLPFQPTAAQDRAIGMVRSGMASPLRMNRLLQGDVGSGKTLVAMAAAVFAVESGFRAALLAPTQILAEQHWQTFRKALEPLGLQVALKTASRTVGFEEESLFARASRNTGTVALPAPPHVIIGTHALLYGSEHPDQIGVILIDEQHKFGVLQRAALAARHPAADVLVLTATPIPRTLAQTAYGDLDVTTLDELPPGRGKIITGVRPSSKLKEAAKFLREHLASGRQCYIVYPLIDESEKISAKAANEEFTKWSAALAPHSCGLLHGRLESAEKNQVLDAFRRGEIHALVSTTVIEVGIDVPNATIMLVENAERFGLAQLHQLRGRIGRGAHTSYCILVPGNSDAETMDRLRVLEKTTDGFAVAEEDLRLRGPGDVLGVAQTGLPALRLGDLARDADLISRAREIAARIFADDPELKRPEHVALRNWIARHQRSIALANG